TSAHTRSVAFLRIFDRLAHLARLATKLFLKPLLSKLLSLSFQHSHHLSCRLLHEPQELSGRSIHQVEKLRECFLPARQARNRHDTRHIKDGPFYPPALEGKLLILLRELRQNLRRGYRVALREYDKTRPLKERNELLPLRLLGFLKHL